MTLSLNCKDAGDPRVYPYNVWGNRGGINRKCKETWYRSSRLYRRDIP